MYNNIDEKLAKQDIEIENIKRKFLTTSNIEDSNTIYKKILQEMNIDIPQLKFSSNSNVIFVTNEIRKKYLLQLENMLSNYNLSFDNLYNLTKPIKTSLTNLINLNKYIFRKTQRNILFELNLIEKLICSLNELEKFEDYLEEKGKMYNTEYNIIHLGLLGENIVNKELSKYNDLINLPNIRMESLENSVESDNIIISKYGIFILEVKNIGNLGNYQIKIDTNGNWYKIFNNRHKIPMNNIIEQVNRHKKYTQEIINKELVSLGLNKINIYPIIVFANDIKFKNYSNFPIIYVNEIYKYITNNTQHIDFNNLNIITNIVKQHNLGGKSYPIEDIRKYILVLIRYFNTNQNFYDYLYNKLYEYSSSL